MNWITILAIIAVTAFAYIALVDVKTKKALEEKKAKERAAKKKQGGKKKKKK